MVSFAIRSPRSGRQKGSLPQVVSLSPAYAGLSPLTQCHPGLADSALGYMLSPATRVAAAHTMSPRARGLRPGLYAVARVRGLCRRSDNVTRARGLALGYMLSPAYAGCVAAQTMSPRARGLALGYMLSPAYADCVAAHAM